MAQEHGDHITQGASLGAGTRFDRVEQPSGHPEIEGDPARLGFAVVGHASILEASVRVSRAYPGQTGGMTESALAEERRRLLGAALRELRLRHGLTQQRLADISGIDRKSIVRAEAGQRAMNIDRLWLLADSLHVTLSELVSHAEAGDAS